MPALDKQVVWGGGHQWQAIIICWAWCLHVDCVRLPQGGRAAIRLCCPWAGRAGRRLMGISHTGASSGDVSLKTLLLLLAQAWVVLSDGASSVSLKCCTHFWWSSRPSGAMSPFWMVNALGDTNTLDTVSQGSKTLSAARR